MRKPLIFLALTALVLALAVVIGRHPPDMEALRDALAAVSAWQAEHPVLAAALFFVAYVAVAALSLPLAVWMTLAGAALFGFFWGLLLVSFASSVGATLAFLASRHLLSDWVHERMGARLAVLDEGMRRDGALYLLTLRLLPVVPFFAVNLLMGLTPIPAWRFYLVSQIGMLPATVAFVNAGTRIGELESLAGILSLPMVLSIAALALLPWGGRLVANTLRRRRVYARWKRPDRFDRNLIVIGAGSAGLVSAYLGAAVKARVTLVEAHRMGGDCLHTGCVPSKALIRVARLAKQISEADGFGLTGGKAGVDWPRVMARVRSVIAGIAPHDSVERYESLGVEVLQGRARLVDPWTVAIAMADGTQQMLTTRAIILATGAVPSMPPLPGLDQVGALTSDTMWDAFEARETAPGRLIVLGGGPVGCELAQAFARLGSAVTQIEMLPHILPREDEDVSTCMRQALEADGVTVLAGHRAIACGMLDGEKWIEIAGTDGASRRVGFDDIIVAVGRTARLTGYGLEDLGIATHRVIETNDYLQTIYPNILAAGDVAGPYQFTHTAAHQAWFATVNALFGFVWRQRADYRVIPAATFTDPEVARVGLNEQEARAKGIAYEVSRYDIDDLDRAIADGSTRGFVKVLTAPGSDRILGATIVSAHAGDLVAEMVLAMKHGLGLQKILATIHIYPTLAEANKFAAGVWRRNHVNPRLMALLERLHGWRRGR